MTEETPKTAVFIADENGKPKQVAIFSDADDAQFFARRRYTRFGTRNYVGPSGNKEKMERVLAGPKAAAPLQSAMDVRVANMRATVAQEQSDAEIRKTVEADMKEPDKETKEAMKASEDKAIGKEPTA